MTTYTVRIYGDDPQAGPLALLGEHDYLSEAEAREFAGEAVRSGAARVTLNGTGLGRYEISNAGRGRTYSGITQAEAEQIARDLTARDGGPWIIARIAWMPEPDDR
jgi:hypothetical protein